MNDQLPPQAPFAPHPPALKKPDGMGRIIAVASGKGGVGKSTVSANLAAAIFVRGKRVGVFDADIPGHSQSFLYSPAKDFVLTKGEPVMCNGVKVVSFGFLYPDSKPVIWRGPMISNGIKSFFTETRWGEIDYLVIDLPPGTSDAQLTILRDMPIDGGIIVTTPDKIATSVAERGLAMFRELGKSVFGIVENMSHAQCPECGHAVAVFGKSHADEVAMRHGTELLGQIPIDSAVQASADARSPVVFHSPASMAAKAYFRIADALIKVSAG